MPVRPLIVGNWKMNLDRTAAGVLARDLVAAVGAGAAYEIAVCPPAPYLSLVAEVFDDGLVGLGGQDCHTAEGGAHTGDISARMLADLGCRFVIVGHSERRADHCETDALVRSKAEAAIAAGLVPIICVGETEAERDAGRTLDVIASQMTGSVPDGLDGDQMVVAYEPVWAIGTGRTPTIADIASVHSRIRSTLADKSPDPAMVRILYGGSVKPSNAAELLAVTDVDGALVGGASLKAQDFLAICRSVPVS